MMMQSTRGISGGNVYAALLHFPVYDKNHREVATCITNLDLHDMARVSATYGVRGFYVVTPMASQREYARRLIAHWVDGMGGRYNPHRKEALQNVRLVAELKNVVADVIEAWGKEPKTVVTCAREVLNAITYEQLRRLIFEHCEEIPYIIVFGTGWGLTQEVTQKADYVLEPIAGNSGYNHLSVRCAAAIIMDRLLGRAVPMKGATTG